MTAAELLRSAEPPPDDGLIEKAIADLDMRIWEWADALKNAHSQLRGAFAARPAQKPSAALYDIAPSNPNLQAAAAAAHLATAPASNPSLSAAAAAAHISSPPPMPAEWTAPPGAPPTDWAAAGAAMPAADSRRPSNLGGHGASAGTSQPRSDASGSTSHGVQVSDNSQDSGQVGVMAWPTAPSGGWPDSSGTSAPAVGPQAWPTWTPTDASATASSSQAKKGAVGGTPVRPGKAAKAAKPVIEGPTPEERAQKAAAEEALLSQLEDAIARRVRLLRRLDPDTAIEKLIDKAKQGQAETSSAASAKDDKSSWWRRK